MARAPRSSDYLLLGVTPQASPTELLRAFRRRARDLHPDVRPDDPEAAARFRELTAAYQALASAAAASMRRSTPVVVRHRRATADEPPLRATPPVVRPWPRDHGGRDD